MLLQGSQDSGLNRELFGKVQEFLKAMDTKPSLGLFVLFQAGDQLCSLRAYVGEARIQ